MKDVKLPPTKQNLSSQQIKYKLSDTLTVDAYKAPSKTYLNL